ncbi:3-hydroxyanthranilate 3,4-dioxygenase [Streptomyces sp. RB5]|uniref:3-hydroxyanthranilate 3,4-dioxygenase n=1 Tax=Streptomyces smaragdinus TaxID=2585196 RepID=A0A7K0CLZ9_9ACTN|nr:3-hydroxybutyryl-CoA dehydratase [Streptomyces smaragdinus]MQY14509.1 3-hydroxyanthranilate 3,4-dioxygenase [Streptomyces smaragdinus]
MTKPLIAMPIVDLDAIAQQLGESGKRVHVLWQESESLAFVARGREYRSEFHINPSDEVMYMIRGSMNLHYRDTDGTEKIAVIPEGECIFTPTGVAHSPRFAPDAYVLVTERLRRPGEKDRFQWFCMECDNFLHEESVHVADYRTDPVAGAYQSFFDNEEARTCDKCGTVAPTY